MTWRSPHPRSSLYSSSSSAARSTMFIYLAHPIDQATPAVFRPLTNVLAHLSEAIRQQGHSSFQPGSAYRLSDVVPWSTEDMQHVDSINRAALFESDAVLAVLLPGIA